MVGLMQIPPMPGSNDQLGGILYDSDFRRIEELIKGNNFSREEINHLLEILDSRAADESDKQTHNDAATDTALALGRHEILTRSTEEKQHSADRMALSTPRENREVPVGVSASPIDIARAYMAGRASEGGHDLHGFASTAENRVHQEFTRRELLPPPFPKPSICWPGAMTADRPLGYVTPLSQKGRHTLDDFPRTPYSRSLLPKSTSRLRRTHGAYASPSTPFQQPQTSSSGKVRSTTVDTVDVFGSVGPIRRIRNKFASEVRPRGSIFLSSPKNVHSNIVEPKASEVLLPSSMKNIETGETSGSFKYVSGQSASGFSDRNTLDSNISSNGAVRKILEHLGRTKPTPKDKEAELGLATSWEKASNPQAIDTIREENISTLPSDKNFTTGHNFAMEFDKSRSKSKYPMEIPSKGMSEAKDAVNGITQTCSTIFSGSRATPGANALPPFGPKWTSDSASMNLHENASTGTVDGRNQSKFQSFQPSQSNIEDSNIFPKNNHGNKPSLPSISIHKPEFRAMSANNGLGFTFPVFASSGVSAEPTTPSIARSASTMVVPQPVPDPNVPYSFGNNRSTPRLVFSFPSVTNASTEDDSNIEFSFGSEKNPRLPFGSLKRDGICY